MGTCPRTQTPTCTEWRGRGASAPRVWPSPSCRTRPTPRRSTRSRTGSRSTSASCPTRSTSPRTSRGARERERGRQKEAWKRHFSLFDMKYERAVAKSKRQDLLCSRILGHIGFDVGNNQIFLFSLLEYGSEERPKMKMLKHESWAHPTFSPF